MSNSLGPLLGARQAPLFMGFSRQEYWSGLPFPSPDDLPHLGLEPRSPTLQVDSLPPEPPGKPCTTTCERVRALSLLTGALGSGYCVPAPAQSRGTQAPASAEGGKLRLLQSLVGLPRGIRIEALFELHLYGKWEGWEKFQAGLRGERSEWFHSVYS